MKVLLPVSALQLISYAHLVEELTAGDPNHKTASQWGDQRFGTIRQLRTVLKVAGIDMNVPKHLAHLAKVQADITTEELPEPDALDCVLPHEYWTLIGGLMVQLHAIHHGIDVVRPTNDVDLIVHVETGRGRPRTVVEALIGHIAGPDHLLPKGDVAAIVEIPRDIEQHAVPAEAA